MSPQPLPSGWNQMLDHVQERVAEALAALDQRERTCPPESTPSLEETWPPLEDQQSWLTAQLHRIGEQMGDVDQELQAGEAALKRHLSEVEQLGANLRNWLNQASVSGSCGQS